MTTACRPPIEPCHVGECDGFDEIVALLPPGQLWRVDRDSVYTRFVRAVGDIKTELNRRICQEWRENDPCAAIRLRDYWAEFYGFPDCLPLTGEALCNWIMLIRDPSCPPGTLGFMQKVLDLAAPGATIAVNYPDFFGGGGIPASRCADKNALVVTAPPEMYRYYVVENPVIADYFDPQDGVDGCKRYFIPEIDCLRKCVFPLGLSVGYKTDPAGPNGEDIYGVPASAITKRVSPFIECKESC